MTMICNCPVGAEITDITLSACPEKVGQIQKIVFQRVFSTGSTKNTFVKASADPKNKASWTPLLAASDGTKVVQSPFIENPQFEAGAPRKVGGGNATLGGIQRIIGAEPTTFKGVISNYGQAAIKQMKDLMCEQLGIYLVDENGAIWMLGDATNYWPIPIVGLFISDKKLGGLEEDDVNNIEFSFKPNWSDTLVKVTPADFDALNDLVTA